MAKEKTGLSKLLDTKDSTKDFEKKDIENNKGMAVLSYILAPIPYFAEKKSKFVKYNAKQGMDLFIIIVAYSIIYPILTSIITITKTCNVWGVEYPCGEIVPWWVRVPLMIVGLVIGIIAVIGIINVLNGKAKELPIINKLKFFK